VRIGAGVLIAGALAAAAAASGQPARQAPVAKPAPVKSIGCVDCHLALDDPRISPPAKLFGDDIHARAGFTCASCHGGDPAATDQEVAHDKKKGFLGKPSPHDIPALCGKCHSDAALMKQFNPSLRVDQLSEYRTSGHGKALAAGDTQVAQCASCHGAHGIQQVKDSRSPVAPRRVAETCNGCHGNAALMAGYKLPADVYAKWKKSVHYQVRVEKGDLSAPTCNSCHGNHGAAPPEVGSVANVCGTCHSVFSDRFKQSPHAKPFQDMGLPGCVTCHENHEIVAPTEAFFAEGEQGKCSSCHEPTSAGGKAAAAMRTDLTALVNQIATAREKVEKAEEAGMEISRIRFELSKADDALTTARTEVHRFQVAAVHTAASSGLVVAAAATKAADGALAERDYRRKGLFISLGIILLAIAALLLKIRDLKGPSLEPPAPDLH
jgi:hypothetical protein